VTSRSSVAERKHAKSSQAGYLERVHKQPCSVCAILFGFPIDSLNGLQ
jgi:hypothetical protein